MSSTQSSFESPPFREGESIEFIVDGPPQANREHVVQFGGHGSIRRTTETLSWLNWAKLNAKQHAPPELWTGPLFVHCQFIFRRIKFRKKDGPGRQPHLVKPDLFNCLKLAEDCLKDRIIVDDSLDMLGGGEKWYAAEGEAPHTRIRITRLCFGSE